MFFNFCATPPFPRCSFVGHAKPGKEDFVGTIIYPFMPTRFRSVVSFFATFILSIGLTHGDGASPLLWASGKAPGPFLDAVQSAGATAANEPEVRPDADIIVYDASQPFHATDAIHAGMETVLKKGGSVIISLATGDKVLHDFEDLTPVNFWSVESSRLERLGTGAVAPTGSPFAAALQTPGFTLAGRFDLHLPYSPTEAGQQRYDWEHLGKSLLNTDWQILLTTDQDGRLPLLIEGRCFAGHVFVFGGDLYAPELTAWTGYKAFIAALLTAAAPQPVPADTAVGDLKLSVAPYQPGNGPLSIAITNPGGAAVDAVLAGKVRRLTQGLLNSFSQDVSIPAGQTVTISVPESAPVRDISIAPPSGDSSLPYRRVELGLASKARQEIAVHLDAVVDRTPAVTVQIEGEDVRQFPTSDGWRVGGNDMLSGNGMPLDRYAYFCGEQPKITVNVSNGFHNVAPLAVASDVNQPDNYSAQGLNDGALSYESVRGKYPVTGYWSGRAAATQKLHLAWASPVMAAGQDLLAQTDYRHWDKANPPAYTLTADGAADSAAPLVTVPEAAYTYGRRSDSFPATVVNGVTLNITGLDPNASGEPSTFRDTAQSSTNSNCALGEWCINGWPDATPPPAVHGHLTITFEDLSDDSQKVLLDKDVTLDPISQQSFPVELPTRQTLGQVCVHVKFTPDKATESVASDMPLLFVPEKGTHLADRDLMSGVAMGFLCAPGFESIDDFGIGTADATEGWGGPDNNAWAWSHDLMETGDPRNRYYPQRFLVSPVGMSHYTDPWRDFSSGQYVWDWASDKFVTKMTTGSGKGKDSLHIMLADRWNGIPIGSAFMWSNLVSFDAYLRSQGKPGLTGRTRADLWKEIVGQHSDEFQKYELQRYADAMTNLQKRLAAQGVSFTTETHGSFPLAGGDIGAQLATTDTAVGTDLFWELRDEDIFKGIGYRIGLVAANPDLKSGAYDQWEWTSGTQQNPTWFSPSADVEPARLQWYNTYWNGRVTSDGEFQPYTVYGFSMQGGFGSKSELDDWVKFNRVQSTMIWVRPEQPVGIGIAPSWRMQERRMAPNSTAMGFGLYASNGYHPDNPRDHSGQHLQIDQEVGETYFRLKKNGVPISFVASTATLKKWNGTQPLVAIDAISTEPWEIDEFDRLNRAGAPIIAVSSEDPADSPQGDALFGVSSSGDSFSPGTGTRVVNDASGKPLAYVCERAGRGTTVFCPVPIMSLDGTQSTILAGLIQEAAGNPLTLPYGVSASPFVSQGSLFIGFGNLSDNSRLLDIAVRPSRLSPLFTGENFRVIDHDRGVSVPSEWKDGALHFQIPAAPSDGRLIQIMPLASKT